VAEMISKNPFVAGLFESLAQGTEDPDLKQIPESEREAARLLLTELLMDGKAGNA